MAYRFIQIKINQVMRKCSTPVPSQLYLPNFGIATKRSSAVEPGNRNELRQIFDDR